VALLALALAGCGGGGTKPATTTSGRLNLPGNIPLPPKNPIVPMTFRAELSGTVGTSGAFPAPPGAPNASGLAVVSVRPPDEICWKFSQLRNVTAPTIARVYFRPAGPASWRFGFPLGHTYRSSGCIHTPEGTKPLEAAPQEWWVSIHTARFPGGAVRGQL
jgi:CHRD domain